MNDPYEFLWERIVAAYDHPGYSVHGPDHWRRVRRNGFLLATRTGADPVVVSLFALLHDSRRENDWADPGHGARGAAYALALQGSAFDISDQQLELLHYACTWHTDGLHHADPTIATCWDADRLDLGRVGIVPSPEFLSTDFAREIAGYGGIEAYLENTGAKEDWSR